MPYTTTGRVVYDRKKHHFNWCDIRRILNSNPEVFTDYQELCKYTVEEEIVREIDTEGDEALSEAVSSLLSHIQTQKARLNPSTGERIGPGGGSFGGGGATWRWWRPFDPGPGAE